MDGEPLDPIEVAVVDPADRSVRTCDRAHELEFTGGGRAVRSCDRVPGQRTGVLQQPDRVLWKGRQIDTVSPSRGGGNPLKRGRELEVSGHRLHGGAHADAVRKGLSLPDTTAEYPPPVAVKRLPLPVRDEDFGLAVAAARVARWRMTDCFDVIVIGAGPAGETAAGRLAGAGLNTALIERELIGGECAYWACIPSKTLLRAAEIRPEAKRTAGTDVPGQRWEAIAKYRDYMIRDLDDSDELDSYAERGVHVVKGPASFLDPGRISAGGEELASKRIIIATGSETAVPEIPGLEQAGYWTNREATTFAEPPESVCVLGGGPVGIELAQLCARFGSKVHLVEQADRLLAREDERVGELVRDALEADGIEIHLGAEANSVSTANGRRIVELAGDEIAAEQVLVATSRRPRISGLGLDNAGVEAGDGGIKVDEHCRAADGIWAIGDVTGAMPFSHVAKYQGRIACADILGNSKPADYTAIPRAVFCDPELAAVGVTEQQARDAGTEIVVGHVKLANSIARPSTYETDPRGELTLIADERQGVLIGAWAIAPNASEWIHEAVLAIKARIPLDVLKDTVAQFPTYSEGYLEALEELG